MRGYTIVEVLIVLAVTMVLFVSAMLMIGGQRGRTEFSSSVREFESQIQDVINDVGTGYYARTTNFNCSATGGGSPTVTPVPGGAVDSLGTQQDCIFLGRGLQFQSSDQYFVHTLVGRRLTGSGNPVASLTQARPISIYPAGTSSVDGTEIKRLPGGITILSAKYSGGDTGTILFYSPFSTASPTSISSSSQQRAELAVVDNTTLASDRATTANFIAATSNIQVPGGGVTLCIKSGGSNQYAVLTIGGDERSMGTELTISETACT